MQARQITNKFDSQEDAHSTELNFNDNKHDFFGVFDGHRGKSPWHSS